MPSTHHNDGTHEEDSWNVGFPDLDDDSFFEDYQYATHNKTLQDNSLSSSSQFEDEEVEPVDLRRDVEQGQRNDLVDEVNVKSKLTSTKERDRDKDQDQDTIDQGDDRLCSTSDHNSETESTYKDEPTKTTATATINPEMARRDTARKHSRIWCAPTMLVYLIILFLGGTFSLLWFVLYQQQQDDASQIQPVTANSPTTTQSSHNKRRHNTMTLLLLLQ